MRRRPSARNAKEKLDADGEVNEAGEAETESTVPDQWAAEANADGRDALVPDEPEGPEENRSSGDTIKPCRTLCSKLQRKPG